MVGRVIITLFAFTAVALGMVFILHEQDKARRQPISVIKDEPSRPRSEPSATGLVVAGNSIAWQKNLDQALALAKANKTTVVVDIYTDWCGWCKRMDKDIYTHPQIISLSNRYVFLKLNAEDGGQGARFAQKNNVEGYPTTVIIDENGRYLRAVPGYPPSVQTFANFIERG
jgi:thiol:disulfide interchange protein